MWCWTWCISWRVNLLSGSDSPAGSHSFYLDCLCFLADRFPAPTPERSKKKEEQSLCCCFKGAKSSWWMEPLKTGAVLVWYVLFLTFYIPELLCYKHSEQKYIFMKCLLGCYISETIFIHLNRNKLYKASIRQVHTPFFFCIDTCFPCSRLWLTKTCYSCITVKMKTLTVFTPWLWIFTQITLFFSCIQMSVALQLGTKERKNWRDLTR